MLIERGDNAISQKIRRMSGEDSWADLLFRSKRLVSLKVRAEEIDFERVEVFIADINKKTRGAFAEFTVEHMIYVLYEDFLVQIRENLNEEKVDEETVTMKDTVNGLLRMRNVYFPRKKGETAIRKRWALMEIRLKRETAQRGRVFLYDANTVFPEFEMSLEELLSILFCDFVSQLRRGNQKDLVRTLIDKFSFHDFE
ncbi:hypothetical protein [Paenibacillus gansuensis]|uniref:Uncharacterized protein n=1 Tax=Paenibacillus gansuensis TaxID=306542 RepID=A0ABW5PH55_9BACL